MNAAGIEPKQAAPEKVKLLDQVREVIRLKHYSIRTEESYVGWIRKFILFHGKRHPAEMTEAEVRAFLSHLATHDNVTASTQNQAFSALLFLYRQVLKQELGQIEGVERAKRPARLPLVLTRAEVKAVLSHLKDTEWLMASLLYGAGLRLMECLRLRVKDIDFGYHQVVVRDGKGQKDRVTMLPQALEPPLQRHLERVKALHQLDLRRGLRRRLLALRAGTQVSGCAQGMGLAVRFPFRPAVEGSAKRRRAPASP